MTLKEIEILEKITTVLEEMNTDQHLFEVIHIKNFGTSLVFQLADGTAFSLVIKKEPQQK